MKAGKIMFYMILAIGALMCVDFLNTSDYYCREILIIILLANVFYFIYKVGVTAIKSFDENDCHDNEYGSYYTPKNKKFVNNQPPLDKRYNDYDVIYKRVPKFKRDMAKNVDDKLIIKNNIKNITIIEKEEEPI